MKSITINFDTDNDAFKLNEVKETRRMITAGLDLMYQRSLTAVVLTDINGNSVGTMVAK